MSQTYTISVNPSHLGVDQKRRNSKLQHRSSRPAPPFPLPRITSGVVASEEPHTHRDPSPHKDELHSHEVLPLNEANLSSFAHTSPLTNVRSLEVAPAAMAPQHKHTHRDVSRITDILLHASENNLLLHSILADKESRRIFYFMCLNLAFMGVQSAYGFLTGSLGLISDSIHMFFDCVALLVGMCATVMSKWSPSTKFPYGYGKIDTLAGLGNGIFLMLISVEIMYEAVERLFTGSDLSRTTELLIVSTLGFLVNLVGIFAFHGAHDHHGHDHNHGHDHGENMQGIYLHIMADALGSISVIASTILVQFTGWSGWDPIASCIIAVLIFVSVIPLVSSSIKKMLLTLDDNIEYNLRDVIGGIAEIRGVIGYTVPKFWLEDIKKESHNHHHDHNHDHNHTHSEPHSHNHRHQNSDTSLQSHASEHFHETHSRQASFAHGGGSHDHHDHDHHVHSHDHASTSKILGTIHIQISSSASLTDVQSRVSRYFSSRNMEVVVQYEREGENKCWCTATLPQSANSAKIPLKSMSFSNGNGGLLAENQRRSIGGYGGYQSEKAKGGVGGKLL